MTEIGARCGPTAIAKAAQRLLGRLLTVRSQATNWGKPTFRCTNCLVGPRRQRCRSASPVGLSKADTYSGTDQRRKKGHEPKVACRGASSAKASLVQKLPIQLFASAFGASNYPDRGHCTQGGRRQLVIDRQDDGMCAGGTMDRPARRCLGWQSKRYRSLQSRSADPQSASSTDILCRSI